MSLQRLFNLVYHKIDLQYTWAITKRSTTEICVCPTRCCEL